MSIDWSNHVTLSPTSHLQLLKYCARSEWPIIWCNAWDQQKRAKRKRKKEKRSESEGDNKVMNADNMIRRTKMKMGWWFSRKRRELEWTWIKSKFQYIYCNLLHLHLHPQSQLQPHLFPFNSHLTGAHCFIILITIAAIIIVITVNDQYFRTRDDREPNPLFELLWLAVKQLTKTVLGCNLFLAKKLLNQL